MTDIEATRALVRVARLLERASGELSLAHYRVLAAVDDGDERASRVAARLALGKPTISASVDALTRRGYLERDAVADDGRATALRLTSSGRAALAAAEIAMSGRLDAVLARVPNRAAVTDALGALGTGLDSLAADLIASSAAR